MIRSKIFNYRTSKRVFEHFLLKNKYDVSVKNACQCISTTNFSTLSREHLTSKPSKESEFLKNKESEKDFLVRLKNDPDIFGKPQQEDEIIDEGDIREEKYLTERPVPSQRLSTKQYADIIKRFIRQRRIKEAIDFVEVRMIKEDRVKPEAYIFNLLLGACGRVGYTKKAFMLYNNMKKRGLNIMGGTYTALFNACSNSPWPEDGLSRANKLREIMIEKDVKPNKTIYNSMIKAFGRCGDMSTAFLIVDEMIATKKFSLREDTINFLLQACITDKEAGFRHTLLVWRKLIEKRIQPNVYTYNLLLRSIRDCGLGDTKVLEDVINQLVSGHKTLLTGSNSKMLDSGENKPKQIASNEDLQAQNTENYDLESTVDAISTPSDLSMDKYLPNLLAITPHLGNIISLSDVKKPEDRLFLVGGAKGFLGNMDEHSCKPDIKTLTQLLDCIPSTVTAENELLSLMKKYRVKPDLDFYNMLIKKKSMRRDYAGGKEVVQLMRKSRFRPDLITYGVLALGCETKDDCINLIEEMKQCKYSLNIEILGAMLYQACYYNDFDYAVHVMDLCQTETINPSKRFIEIIEQFKKKCRQLYDAKELTKMQRKSYIEFKKKYTVWLQQVHIDESEDVHPWQQFRQLSEENKYYKTKDTARFKRTVRSKFRVKTSPKYVQISKNIKNK